MMADQALTEFEIRQKARALAQDLADFSAQEAGHYGRWEPRPIT